jgi:NAD(P)-dependent dehydrogenase (short-subunit alcohol dehydrogenase family)
MPVTIDLSGKTAFVTGSTRGIGLAIARALRASGARVAIVGRDLERARGVAQELGEGAAAVACDVAVAPQVEGAMAEVEKALGPIDILVNNAGIETIVPFLEITDDQWTRLVDTNLRGAWLCSQILCRKVVEAKRPASIVNIGSIQAAKVLPGRTHYAPTKLGIEALTRNMSA